MIIVGLCFLSEICVHYQQGIREDNPMFRLSRNHTVIYIRIAQLYFTKFAV